MKEVNKMILWDRIYWVLRNLLALILLILVSPVYWVWKIIYSTIGAIVILFITDGSETIAFPSDWDWE